jgi:hypothetical protein
MNKSQRIFLGTGNTSTKSQDKYIKIKLEQDVETLEFLTLNLSTEDAYQNFNADYGVLVGRVAANDGVGVPNAKISIFIALTDADAEDSNIYSIYPYKTPRDKNNEGKRYNLLPRVSELNQETGTYKPKQPFGSFPIKPELVVNEPFLNVYKKYYKYTALTNNYGDYMIFGVPTGTQTAHLSVDITDIGKYSMSPASMINAGYSSNLFNKNASAIKPAIDLTDLPNIETQDITVDIIPFWGDTTNFEIGITQLNFRIKAILSSSFVIFGTTMTMGLWGIFGNPDAGGTDNLGFYSLDDSNGIQNNMDIRTYRTANPIIRVFTYTTDVPLVNGDIDWIHADTDKQIRELDKTEYIEYNTNGDFLLSIPCNRVKVITSPTGENTVVDDNSTSGVFTKFFGMILIKYPDLNELPENSAWSNNYEGDHPQHKARGWFKIPQDVALYPKEVYKSSDLLINPTTGLTDNELWRREYYTFTGGGVYSIAQFYPTKKSISYPHNESMVLAQPNTENMFSPKYLYDSTAGSWFKVAGTDFVTQAEATDQQNYISGGTPTTGVTSSTNRQFTYDFAPNIKTFGDTGSIVNKNNKFFGGQWLNFCLCFPCYGWAFSPLFPDRTYFQADIYHHDFYPPYPPPTSTTIYYLSYGFYIQPNNQKLFAGITDTSGILRGDTFRTAFINIPKSELTLLSKIPIKGINIRKWNSADPTYNNYYNYHVKYLINLSASNQYYKYQNLKPSGYNTNGQQYYFGWDDYYSDYSIPTGELPTAYLFKGMYGNDCIQLLADFNII